VALAGGGTAIYGGTQDGGGLATLMFDPLARLQDTTFTPDTGNTVTRDITSVAAITLGDTPYIFTTSDTELWVSGWRLADDGELRNIQSIGSREGFWINAPTALATVSVGDRGFPVLAAAGSGSLSVMEIAANGLLS